MAEKTLEIILKARDLAGRPIEALKDRIQRTRDAINQTDRKGGIGAVAKTIGDLGKLTRAVAVVEQGANAATGIFKAGSAVFKTWSGDAEGAAEAVKATGEAFEQIPVAGKAFGAGNFIGQWLFGDQADADAATKEIEKIEAALKKAAAAAKERKKEIAFAEGFGQELQTRARTRGLEGPDLAAEQQRIKYEQEQAKLTESIETVRRNSVGTNAAAIETQLAGHYAALEALAKDHAATMQAIEDKRFADRKAAEEKRNAEIEQNRRTTLRIIEEAQREAYTGGQATREAAMRATGDTAGADALALKRAWEQEANGINKARTDALAALPADATAEQARAVVDAYDKAYTAAWDRWQIAQGQKDKEAGEKRADAQKTFAQRVADMEFQAMQEQLRAGGMQAEARRLELERNHAREMELIKKQAKEALEAGVDPAEVEAMRLRAEAAIQPRPDADGADEARNGGRAGRGFDARVMRFGLGPGGAGAGGAQKPRLETLTEQQLREQQEGNRTLVSLLDEIKNSPGLSPAGL